MGTSYNPKIITNNLVFNIDPANIKSYPASQDTYINNVSLMLDGESLNDSSINNVTITNNGASVSSSQFKFGSNSLYISGSSVYISMPTSTNFAFGTGDYTIECWLYMTTISGQQTLFVAGTGSNVGNFAAYFNGGSTLDIYNNGIGPAKFSGSCVISTNTWFHFAVTRSSGTVRVFINGSLQSSATDTYSYTSTSGTARIGNDGLGGFNLNAYIDDFRITKGYARYTANFTPPAGPLPLPGRITDLTKNKATASFLNGPIYASGNVIFDGVNDYINIPSSTNLTFGTGDFTMEVWFKTRAKTMLYPTVLGINAPYAANVWVLCDRHNSTPTKFTFHVANIASPLLTSLTTPSNGNWYQVVITRISNTWSMYVNGSLEATASSAGSLDGGVSTSINLGRESASDNTYYDGNISILRMYKNKGLTSNEVLQNYNATKGRFGL